MLLLIVLHLLALMLLPRCWSPRAPTQWREASCRDCGYDLGGLAEDAPCPECGETLPRERDGPGPPAFVWDDAKAVYLGVLLLAWILAGVSLGPAVNWAAAWGMHLHQGFTLSSAQRWASMRTFPGPLWTSTTIPVMICAPWVLSLWFTRFASIKRRYAAGLGLVAATWVAFTGGAFLGA